VCKNSLVRSEDLQLASIQLGRRPVEGPSGSLHAPDADAQQQLQQALLALFEENHSALFEQVEETVMRAAYDYCHHNQVQAAKLLGISRNVIRSRLIKIGAISALK